MKARRPSTKTVLAAYKKMGFKPVRGSSPPGESYACGLGVCLAERGLPYWDDMWRAEELWGVDWVAGFCRGWDSVGLAAFLTPKGQQGFKAGEAAAKAVFEPRRIQLDSRVR